jgi:hypothetical protein
MSVAAQISRRYALLTGGSMRRIFGLVLVLTSVIVFSVGISVAAAGTKLSSTEILDNGNLIVSFEERGLKRFSSVDYQLDATASVSSPTFAQLFEGLQASVTLTPDDKGGVAGTLTLSNVVISPVPCTCGPRQVAYFDMTLTNLTTGHAYSLDPISRDLP